MKYETLEPLLTANERTRWLRRDIDGCVPTNYGTLAAVYRSRGDDASALLVPLVNLGLRDAYDPQGPERWLSYFLIAVGWIFVTTIAAGIFRVLHRD